MKKQASIPGTERESNQRLEDCAEAYHNLVRDRMELQQKEATAKLELEGEIERQVEAGTLSLSDKAKYEIVPIWKYESEEGDERVIRYGNKRVVKVGKAKDAAEAADIQA